VPKRPEEPACSVAEAASDKPKVVHVRLCLNVVLKKAACSVAEAASDKPKVSMLGCTKRRPEENNVFSSRSSGG